MLEETRNKNTAIFFSLLLVASASAKGSPEILDEVIVVSPQTPVNRFYANYTISTVSDQDIRDNAYRNVPQALRDVPGIMVQETSFGQGSPYIRGFTGFRNVFLIDGVKLNNSVFREGPNQYWSTVDAFSLERLEVVSGPSSVLYGSDAIGGAVYAVSAVPKSSGFHAHSRLSSAEHSFVQRLSTSVAVHDNTMVGLGATAKSFGDLEGGKDIGTQTGTGYDEWQADLRVSSTFENWKLDLLHQSVNQNNVPRTHSTMEAKSWEGTSIGSDQKRELDEERSLTYIKAVSMRPVIGLDRLSLTTSFSTLDEKRDRIRSNNRREFEGFDVNTLGLQMDAGKDTSFGTLTLGFDYYRDEVDSFSSRNQIQGPVADDARYDSLDLYFHDQFKIGSVDINAGVRHTTADVDANSVSNPVDGARMQIDDSWSGLVGNLGFGMALIPDTLRFYAGVNQGFRTPNLSDLTRFDTARTNEIEIPSPDLEPEKFVSYETGLKYRGDRTDLQFSIYYTDVDDMIIRFPTGDLIDGEYVITKDNIGEGYVMGAEFSGQYQFTDAVGFNARLSWMDSEISTYPTSEPVLVDEPIDRQMPLALSVGIRYAPSSRYWLGSEVQHMARADDLSTRDAGDTSRIPPGGTPAFTVWHFNGGFNYSENLKLNFSVDNLLDEDYRIHGSGTNMPGRNFILGLTYEL